MPASVGAGLVQEGCERFAIGDVQRMARHRAEAAHPGDRAFENVDVPVADDHPCTPRQQRFRGRVPDATGSAGDDDGLTPDVVHVDDFTGVNSGEKPELVGQVFAVGVVIRQVERAANITFGPGLASGVV